MQSGVCGYSYASKTLFHVKQEKKGGEKAQKSLLGAKHRQSFAESAISCFEGVVSRETQARKSRGATSEGAYTRNVSEKEGKTVSEELRSREMPPFAVFLLRGGVFCEKQVRCDRLYS